MRFAWSCLVVVGLIGSGLVGGRAYGAEAPEAAKAEAGFKPAVVVAVSGYEEFIEDLNFIGETALNQPQFGEQMEQMVTLFTQGQGLVGLDEEKPIGLAVGTDGIDFEILAFLPIDDCKPLMEALAALNPEEIEDGRWRITLPQFNIEINVKSQGGWTYFATKESTLAKLPDNPLTFLGGLDKKYDIAAKASMANLPENFREMAMNALQGGFAEGLQQGGEKLADQVDDEQIKQMEEMLKGLDEITFGWTTNRDDEKLLADFTITAVPGSEYAKQMQLSDEGQTRFSGFLVDDAPLVFNINQTIPEERLGGIEEQMKQFHEMLPKIFEEQMQKAGDNEQQKAANELIRDTAEEFLEVVSGTLKGGKIDVSVSVLGAGPHSIVGAAIVADTGKLSEMVQELKTKGGQLEPPLQVEVDAATHGDVKFHVIDMPMDTDDRESMTKVFGENAQLTIGVGKDTAYFAVGADGVETLTKLIEASEKAGPKTVPAAYLRAELGPLVAMMNELQSVLPEDEDEAADKEDGDKDEAGDEDATDDEEDADEDDEDEEEDDDEEMDGPIPGFDLSELDLSELEFEEDADRIEVTMKAVENGITIHLEAQKGLLVLLGSFAKLAASQAPFPVPGVQ